MEMFKVKDSELASMLINIKAEMERRLAALISDDASIIRGAEAAKRAICVAAAGNHTMLFVGPHKSGKTMLRALAHQLGVISFEVLPCPCGNLMSLSGACICTKAQIKKHQSTIIPQEINIATSFPSQRDLNCKLKQTSLNDMQKNLNEVATFANYQLEKDSESLLTNACLELNLDPQARGTIIKVARTIANLDYKPYIEASHIAEACNYRALLKCPL